MKSHRVTVSAVESKRQRPRSAPITGRTANRELLLQQLQQQTQELLSACQQQPAKKARPSSAMAQTRTGVGVFPAAPIRQPRRSILKSESLASAGVKGVADFLRAKGLGLYVQSFVARGVTGEDLLACDDADLQACGCDFRPHRYECSYGYAV